MLGVVTVEGAIPLQSAALCGLPVYIAVASYSTGLSRCSGVFGCTLTPPLLCVVVGMSPVLPLLTLQPTACG